MNTLLSQSQIGSATRRGFHTLIIVALALLMGIAGAADKKDKALEQVEKLRLRYEKGKMSALLEIIEIYEDAEQPLRVREAAARALGESRHPKALDALALSISNAEALDLSIMITSVDILGSIPSDESARALTAALATTDAKMIELREHLVTALEKIPSTDYIQPLLDLYQASSEAQLRSEQLLVRAIGNLGDERAIPVLMHIATDPNVSLGSRSKAIEFLAKKRSPEVVQLFANMLGDPTTNMQMREFALHAMGDIKEERLVLALLETYQLGRQEYYTLMSSLLTALGDFDDPTIKPTVIEIALSSDFPVNFRKRAISTLANFDDPKVLDQIIPLLQEPDNFVLKPEIDALTAELLPGQPGKERLRRAAYVAAKRWEQGE